MAKPIKEYKLIQLTNDPVQSARPLNDAALDGFVMVHLIQAFNIAVMERDKQPYVPPTKGPGFVE